MRKELPKFFEQILNITDPWYIEKIEQQEATYILINSKRYSIPRNLLMQQNNYRFPLLPLVNLI